MTALVRTLLALLIVTPPALAASPTTDIERRLPAQDAGSGLWGYVDRAGGWVVAPRFYSASRYQNRVAVVGTGLDRWAVIDPEGKAVVGDQPEAPRFRDGLAIIVGAESARGLVSDAGKVVAAPERGASWTLCGDGLALVQDAARDTVGLWTAEGERWSRVVRGTARCPQDGMLPFHPRGRDRGIGFLDAATGRTRIEPTFGQVGTFSEGLLAVTEARYWSYVGTDGKTRIAGPFTEASLFVDGFAVVADGKSEGFYLIDRSGKPVFEAKRRWKDVDNLGEGVARMEDIRGVMQLVDVRARRVVMDRDVAFANLVGPDLWRVRFGSPVDGWSLVDRRGKHRFEPRPKELTPLGEDRFAYRTSGSSLNRGKAPVGLMDAYGKALTDERFTTLEPFVAGAAWATTEAEAGYIGPDGGWIWKSAFHRLEEGVAAAVASYRAGQREEAVTRLEVLAVEGSGTAWAVLADHHRRAKDDAAAAAADAKALALGAPIALHRAATKTLQDRDAPVTAEVLELLSQAAATDYAPAMRDLGLLLLDGKRVPADVTLATRMLKRAADAKDARAEYALGRLLVEGRDGVAPSEQEGLALLERSAAQGFVEAMVAVATIEERRAALGYPKARERAMYYYRAAAERGSKAAAERLQQLGVPATNP